MLTIEGVPQTIARARVVDLVKALGIEPGSVRSLTLHPRSIEAEVTATDEQGRPYVGEPNSVAVHRVQIEIVDEPR